MKTVKVTFDNGDSLTTDINGTEAEIRDYYVGNQFNIGANGNDLVATAKAVEFLSEGKNHND